MTVILHSIWFKQTKKKTSLFLLFFFRSIILHSIWFEQTKKTPLFLLFFFRSDFYFQLRLDSNPTQHMVRVTESPPPRALQLKIGEQWTVDSDFRLKVQRLSVDCPLSSTFFSRSGGGVLGYPAYGSSKRKKIFFALFFSLVCLFEPYSMNDWHHGGGWERANAYFFLTLGELKLTMTRPSG